jgi:hypothetical protein
VVGAWTYDNGETDEGAAFLYAGGCPAGASLPFVDGDGDLVADACDVCVGGDDLRDADLDGVPSDCDVCPFVADPGQEDLDLDGVGDACVPLVLHVHTLSATADLQLEIDDAVPREPLAIFVSEGRAAKGPCKPDRADLCLDLGTKGATRSWTVKADASGHVKFQIPLPNEFPAGTLVTVQALATRGAGGVKSEPVEAVVDP